MSIDENTLYIDFIEEEKYISGETVDNLIQASQELYGNYYELTIENFIDYINNNSDVYEDLYKPTLTVLRLYWFKGLTMFISDYLNILSNFTMKETPEELNASKGCYPVEFSESLLIFSREYFNLHSFKEASQINLADLIIAKKDSYNKALFERNYSQQLMKK